MGCSDDVKWMGGAEAETTSRGLGGGLLVVPDELEGGRMKNREAGIHIRQLIPRFIEKVPVERKTSQQIANVSSVTSKHCGDKLDQGVSHSAGRNRAHTESWRRLPCC